jgi:hypothetical protein
LLRENPNVQGSIYFSSKSFDNNPNGWNDSLQNNYYKYPALLPPMPWISNQKPAPPALDRLHKKGEEISFRAQVAKSNKTPVKYFVLYRVPAGQPVRDLLNQPSSIYAIKVQPEGFEDKLPLTVDGVRYQYYIAAMGKNNIESELVPVTLLVKD